MDLRYMEFALVDSEFYDHPSKRAPSRQQFTPDLDLDWSGWDSVGSDGWNGLHPSGMKLPDQGWKIHVSATIQNAQELLTIISAYCHANKLSFKHVPSQAGVLQRNMKYFDRGSSGKFITIYPRNEDELLRRLMDLDALVGGMEGPYILSDLRWNEGPLYVRYGGFRELVTRNEHDMQVTAVRDPDGVLVPDERLPSFSPPAWVTIPSFLQEQADRLGSADAPDGFDYEITEALHFSNGGGVYRATQISTGRDVILKEGRPHAGLTPDGRDAVARVDAEAAILKELHNESSIVEFIEAFTLFGHRFLACEFVDGETLNTEAVRRSPTIRAGTTRADRDEYRDWALSICDQLEEQLEQLHFRGIVFGDLHPNNLMVRPDGRLTFIDLEMAHSESDSSALILGAPGYVAPDGRRGFAADRYSLGCTKLSLFLPLTMLLNLDPNKLGNHLETAKTEYGLTDEFLDSIRHDINLPVKKRSASSRLAADAMDSISAWDISTSSGIRELQELVVRFIEGSADFSRGDRSYPGDIRQFSENGFGLGHGAAGVVHALTVSGFTPNPLALRWIEDAVAEYHGSHVGLYDGIAGVAWMWRELGRASAADNITDKLLDIDFNRLTSDLYGGLAGVGLFLLSERKHREDHERVDAALEAIADILMRRTNDLPDPMATGSYPTVATGRGGLLWGQAGVSLFASRLYRASDNEHHLQLARSTLDFDLAHCVDAEDGTIQMNEGWRVLAYLGSGSIGSGLAVLEFLDAGGAEDYLDTLDGINRVMDSGFMIQSGVFHGRSGLLLYIAELESRGRLSGLSSRSFEWHLGQLKLHALQNRVGIAFPGEQMLRLSTDLGTGAAGVLLTLEAARRRLSGEVSHRGDLIPLITRGDLSPITPGKGKKTPSHGRREPDQRSEVAEMVK